MSLEQFSDMAEQSVIGALLRHPDSFDQIHWLNASAFHFANNREIYRAISSMIDAGNPIDVVTVAEELERNNKLNMVGGLNYLTDIQINNPGSGNIRRYAEIVQEKAMARDMMAALHDIQTDMLASGSILEKLNRAQSMIMSITDKTTTSEPVFIRDLLPACFERIDDAAQGKILSIQTGFHDLDAMLGGGFENGDLVILAARPSMGKTALAIQIAENIQKPDAAALVFTCEMSNGQIVFRIISGEAKVSSDKFRNGKLTDQDWDGLTTALGKLQNVNILVDDKTYTLNGIRAKARTAKRKHGLSVIVLDYIQLLSCDGDTRNEQISNISRGLKSIAKELEVPVIAISQLSRKCEERSDKRPIMSDLRESGAIEQDADVIGFVYRDEYYNSDSPHKGTAELNIAKNRNGKTGKVILTYQGEFTRFHNFTGQLVEFKKPAPKARGFNDE